MSGKRAAIIELLLGLLMSIIGTAVYWWASQLYWIMIYPTPIEKRLLDGLPYVIWIISAALMADSIKRLVARAPVRDSRLLSY